MPLVEANGVRLFVKDRGSGTPILFVHGSWSDHHGWDLVVPGLSAQFRTVAYDRRGHSQSEGLDTSGPRVRNAQDLLALVDALDFAPTFAAGSSYGSVILLTAAALRPDAFAGLFVHEPPAVSLLADDAQLAPMLEESGRRMQAVEQLLDEGDVVAGARRFVETVAFGPGQWEKLPARVRDTFVRNAATWRNERRDPQSLTIDLAALSRYPGPVVLSQGTQSPPFFAAVLDRLAKALPQAKRHAFEGAGHAPQLSHPDAYVQALAGFVQANAGGR
ncbi:MAG TPA: alpha/beta hydrolase [Candidatus Thermoplasmatota archaeon]|nr:alpha/beta hydrolase [Candidatus Thermoplasmatota archaeon]